MSTYLVNVVLPKVGVQMSCADYRKLLIGMGYSFHQAIGSIGGSKAAGIVVIRNKIIKRV